MIVTYHINELLVLSSMYPSPATSPPTGLGDLPGPVCLKYKERKLWAYKSPRQVISVNPWWPTDCCTVLLPHCARLVPRKRRVLEGENGCRDSSTDEGRLKRLKMILAISYIQLLKMWKETSYMNEGFLNNDFLCPGKLSRQKSELSQYEVARERNSLESLLSLYPLKENMFL